MVVTDVAPAANCVVPADHIVEVQARFIAFASASPIVVVIVFVLAALSSVVRREKWWCTLVDLLQSAETLVVAPLPSSELLLLRSGTMCVSVHEQPVGTRRRRGGRGGRRRGVDGHHGGGAVAGAGEPGVRGALAAGLLRQRQLLGRPHIASVLTIVFQQLWLQKL